MDKTVLQALASAVMSRLNCRDYIEQHKNEPKKVEHWSIWADRHESTIERIEDEYLPRGSGFDKGCTVNLAKSNNQFIIINADFHHVNEHGFYTEWTSHKVIVTPAFINFNMRITGPNKNDIKEYMYDVFGNILSDPYEPA